MITSVVGTQIYKVFSSPSSYAMYGMYMIDSTVFIRKLFAFLTCRILRGQLLYLQTYRDTCSLSPRHIPRYSKQGPSHECVSLRCQWCSIFQMSEVFRCSFCSYKKLAISKHKTVCHHWTWYEAQSFIEPLNRQFLVGAVRCWRSVCRCYVAHCLQCLGALAWWLFWIFLELVCALKKNTNVPPNALALF